MSCTIEPTDKKEFGINVYKKLHETYGYKSYYDMVEIKKSVNDLGYSEDLECWAYVAFMMPANVGEYFRIKGTPLNVLEMKRELIRAMTDGKTDSLSMPDSWKGQYDGQTSELTQMNLVNLVAFFAGSEIGTSLIPSY